MDFYRDFYNLLSPERQEEWLKVEHALGKGRARELVTRGLPDNWTADGLIASHSEKETQGQIDLQPSRPVPAGLGRRLIAFLIDGPPAWAVSFVLGVLGWWLFPNEMAQGGAGLKIVVILVYFGGCHWLWGRTLGKRIMSIRVVSVKDGRKPGLWPAFLRAFVMGLLAILWITWWPVLFRQDRRAIYDLAAGTQVVVYGEPKGA